MGTYFGHLDHGSLRKRILYIYVIGNLNSKRGKRVKKEEYSESFSFVNVGTLTNHIKFYSVRNSSSHMKEIERFC